MTRDNEAIQAEVNTARVQAGSQYAALESAVDYTTDLTAQYELVLKVIDVNFSMETAHLAKNKSTTSSYAMLHKQPGQKFTPVDPGLINRN